jgi:hypothetical protein
MGTTSRTLQPIALASFMSSHFYIRPRSGTCRHELAIQGGPRVTLPLTPATMHDFALPYHDKPLDRRAAAFVGRANQPSHPVILAAGRHPKGDAMGRRPTYTHSMWAGN